jgi:TonB family protein
VKLSIVVGADGRTHNVQVTGPLEPSLDSNAVDAVERWRFSPCKKEGKPVACKMDVEVEYRLGR